MVLLLGIFGLAMTGGAQAQDADPEDDFVEGEIVVKLDPASTATVDDINREYGTRTKERLLDNIAEIYLLEVTDGEDTLTKVGRMGSDGRLLYAEPNFIAGAPEGSRSMRQRGDSAPAPSFDPASYEDQYAVGALNLPEAHGVNRGTGATIAVLDTGVQRDHPELGGSLVPGYDFVGDDQDPSEEPNGKDDDNDCPTADCAYPFVDEATGHGTHVAGIVHLTAPNAKILPLRVLNSDGVGNVYVIAEAIQYAVLGPDRRPNTGDEADVINMSFGTSQESNLFQDVSNDLEADDDADDGEADQDGPALRGVPTNGVVLVGSAGNDGAEQRSYPVAEEGVIGVASVDQDEKKSGFSNYYENPYVDVSAPGDDIYSLFTTNRYTEWDGTSMAAPFVAGQAALIRSMQPKLPSTAPSGQPSVTEFITNTARPLDAQNPDYSGKLGGHADVEASTRAANAAPKIGAMRPRARIKDRTPVLSAVVTDRSEPDLTGSDITLSLDGRNIDAFSYNTTTDRLTYAPGRLSYGRHSVGATATDALGETGTRTWSFRVVR